jgi:hypothetical protein
MGVSLADRESTRSADNAGLRSARMNTMLSWSSLLQRGFDGRDRLGRIGRDAGADPRR